MAEKTKQGLTDHLGKAMLRLGNGILWSKITGLVRDIVVAWFWGGTGVAQAAFNLAFAIPNSLRGLFGEGAFTTAFVPMLSERWAKNRPEEARRLASRAITLQFLILLVLIALFSMISLGLYGFFRDYSAPHIPLALLLIAILMPYAVFICQAAAFAGVLNSLQKFTWPGLVPIIFNIVQVGSILLLCRQWDITERPPVIIFSLSALLAGLLQLLVLMMLSRRAGFTYCFDLHWRDADVLLLGRRIVPGAIGAGVAQLNGLIDKILAARLGTAAIGALSYSQHLVYLPVGIFGVAMGTVCLASMSRSLAEGDEGRTAGYLDYALRQLCFVIFPCAVLFVVLREQVISLLFYRGAFNDRALHETAWALLFYLPGLPAFAAAKIATTPIHARQDTSTPVKISCFCLVLNVFLNLLFMQFLRQGGLALATSVCSWLQVLLLMRINIRFIPSWNVRETLKRILILLIPSAAAGLAAWFVLGRLQALAFSVREFRALAGIVVPGAAGGIVYLSAAYFCRCPELQECLHLFLKKTPLNRESR